MASIIAARAMQNRRDEKAVERAASIKAAKAATAAEMKERAAQAMLSFDANKDGVLSKDEIAAMVKSMAEAQGRETLSEEALESVILHCTGARDGTVPEMECAGLIKTAEQRGQSAAMIDAYLLQSERISKIFNTHDVDESGALSYDELIPALRAELKEAGITARLTAGDVLYIIAECDKDGDQCLSHDEMLPAMGLWVELVKLLPPTAEGDADTETTDEEMLETVRQTLEKGPLQKSAEGEDAGYLAQRKAEKQERINKALEARVHPLEGCKILHGGLQTSKVRTMSGRNILVEKEELVACARAVAKSKKALAKAASSAAASGGEAPTTPRSEKKSSSCNIL